MKKVLLLCLVGLWCKAQNVVFEPVNNAFELTSNDLKNLYYDTNDHKGVWIALNNLQNDIASVSSKKLDLSTSKPTGKSVVLIGTLGKNKWIDQLADEGKIEKQGLAGKWEKFVMQTVQNPFPGVKEALVIVGSDKRGTIYGIYDLAEKIGVSPWHFWADVPNQKHPQIFIKNEPFTLDEPKVKYRGIFLNDEAPCLSGWTYEKNGGFNQKLYTKVFDLILRLKGNYLWPAMWGNAFHVDDPMNPILADEYGVVIGTSHHEPLMRAHDEWRRYGKDKGKWDYVKNDSTLRQFWRESVEQRYRYENIFSVGMRGDGDEPMTPETATDLLEKIVTDQRKIIAETSGKPASEKPSLWALYKEVQDYYDQGMRVPDDITLLLCDDNWGNIRKLPDLNAPQRKGGFGIYYHFDYVGGPRNYKWVNTNPLPRIWEQMNLAYQYNAREIWIVNVGDLKPMEFPISFFLDFAWNPEKLGLEQLPKYSLNWATKTFGEEHAAAIADYLAKYAKYNARVKPELLTATTYSLETGEWQNVVKEYTLLAQKADATYAQITPEYKDAYYQLILYPILACANLNQLYFAHANNLTLAAKKDLKANFWADKVEQHFKKDEELSFYFNHELANGKWNHFADQTHIGYTYWQQPEKNSMPKIIRLTEGKEHTETQPDSTANNTNQIVPKNFSGFLENAGIVSMEAANYSRKNDTGNITWKVIPDIGRTGDGITIFPVNIPSQTLTTASPHLEYDMYWYKTGQAEVTLMLSPTLEFNGNKGLKLAVSMDDLPPIIIEMHADRSSREWNSMVANNIKYVQAKVEINSPGKHTLKVWAIDPAIVLQKIIVSLEKLPKTHLGPPESQKIN